MDISLRKVDFNINNYISTICKLNLYLFVFPCLEDFDEFFYWNMGDKSL